MLKVSESAKNKWRKEIYNYIIELLPGWRFSLKFPNDYNDNFFNSKIVHDQLTLFE